MDLGRLGLQRAPFAEGFDETLCYLTPRHTELLDALKAGIREGRGAVVLTGEAGTGKTTLARQLLGRFDGGHRKAFIACEPDGSEGLIHRVCRELQISTSSSQCPAECAAILRRAIEADDPAGRLHAAVLDAAEQLGPEGLKQLDMLTRLRTATGHALQIALVGRPELLRRLQSGEYPEMVKWFAVAEKLDPLSPHETAQYVRHRVMAAGGDPNELIRPEALGLIVLTSGGVPRNVNEMVSAALELAGACEAPVVTAQIIRKSLTGTYRTRRSTMPLASLTNAAGCLHEMIGRATGVALQAGEKLNTIEERVAELTAVAEEVLDRLLAQSNEIEARGAEVVGDHAATLNAGVQDAIERLRLAVAEVESRGAAVGKMEALLVAASEDAESRGVAVVEDCAAKLAAETQKAVGCLQAAADEMESRCAAAVRERTGELAAAVEMGSGVLTAASRDAESRAGAIVENGATRLGVVVEEAVDRLRATGDEIESRSAASVRGQMSELILATERTIGLLDAASRGAELRAATVVEDCAASLSSRAEEAVERLHAAVEENESRGAAVVADGAAKLGSGVQAAMNRLQSALADIESRGAALARNRVGEMTTTAENAANRVYAAAEEAESQTAVVLADCRSSLTTTTQEAIQRLHGAADEIDSRAAALVCGCTAELEANADEAVVRLRSVSEEVETRIAAAASCEAGLIAASHQADDLAVRLTGAAGELESQAVAAEESLVRLAAGRSAGDETHRRLAQLRTDVAETESRLQQSSAESVRRVEEVIERSVATGKSTSQLCEDTLGRLEQRSYALVEQSEEAAAATVSGQMDLFRARMEKDRSELLQSVRQAIGDEIMVEVRREIDSIRAAAIREARETRNESVRESQVHGREQLAAVESAAARIVRDSVAAVEGAAARMAECLDRAGQVGAKLSGDARSAAAKSDQLVSDIRSAGELAQSLSEANVSAQRALGQMAEQTEAANGAREKLAEEVRTGQQKMQEAGVRAVVEHAAAGMVKAEQAVGILNETVRNAEACAQAAGERIAELEAQAGKRGTVLEAQIADARLVQAKLTAAAESARACADQMQAPADAIRALASEQVLRNEEHRKLIEELAEQTRLAVNIVGHFEEIKNDAVAAYAHLADQSDTARELHERTRELAGRIEQREKHIETEDKLLATLSDEREALELRLQQVQSIVESLKLEVSAVLAQPHKLVCEAKAQAVQLHGVCGAVRKIFAGLSRAALDAQQKTEQARQAVEEQTHQTIDWVNRAMQTVEGQTRQTVDRANRAMQTVEGQTRQTVDRANRAIDQLKRMETIGLALQSWMNETSHTQQHLASLLAAGAPKAEPPAPVAMPAADPQRSELPVMAAAAVVAKATGPKTERKTPTTPANAEKTRAERIDRMIRDARTQAEVAPAKT